MYKRQVLERAKSSILPNGNFREFFLWWGGNFAFLKREFPVALVRGSENDGPERRPLRFHRPTVGPTRRGSRGSSGTAAVERPGKSGGGAEAMSLSAAASPLIKENRPPSVSTSSSLTAGYCPVTQGSHRAGRFEVQRTSLLGSDAFPLVQLRPKMYRSLLYTVVKARGSSPHHRPAPYR